MLPKFKRWLCFPGDRPAGSVTDSNDSLGVEPTYQTGSRPVAAPASPPSADPQARAPASTDCAPGVRPLAELQRDLQLQQGRSGAVVLASCRACHTTDNNLFAKARAPRP